jgi:Protein of unknown function (DUF1573).
MKTYALFVVFLMSFSLVFAVPKLRFECGDTYDWGKIRNAEEPLKAKIKIFNDGDDTLKIYSVKPGCGCTAAPLDRNAIEPKGFATLDVTLIVPRSPGSHTKPITFRTNDPEKSETYLYLKVEVVPPLKFFPDSKIMASNLLIGDTATYKIVMKNTTDENIVVKQPTVEPANSISTNLKPDLVLPPNQEFVLEVKIFPETIGNFSGKVKFWTNLMDFPKVEIPVFGIVTGFKK